MCENKWERGEDGVKHDFHPQLCPATAAALDGGFFILPREDSTVALFFFFFHYSFPIPISTRHASISFRYSRYPTSPSSHPACFHIPPRPSSVHPSTHCVMSLLCESEQFVWQPECNATPLTWESQQSVVLVRETCLGAAVRCEFYRKRTSSGAKPKTKKWTMVNIRSSG